MGRHGHRRRHGPHLKDACGYWPRRLVPCSRVCNAIDFGGPMKFHRLIFIGLCIGCSLPARAARPISSIRSKTAAQSRTDSAPAIAEKLDEVARVGSVMIDGDLCMRIITERAQKYMFAVDPRDQWLASDNYEVNDKVFIAVKKIL